MKIIKRVMTFADPTLR